MAVENVLPRSPRISAKGSFIVHTGTATAEFPVGSDSTYVIANSSASVGINWATTSVYATPTPEVIYSSTATASVSDVTISNIPQTYSGLTLVISGAAVTTAALAASMSIQFNSSSSGYYYASVLGSPITADTGRNTTEIKLQQSIIGSNWSTAVSNLSYGIVTIFIPGYTSTTHNKTITYRSYAARTPAVAGGSWKNTSAITSIKIFPTSLVSFNSGVKVTLYGTSA
jgi:hypothetical protein